MLMKTFFIVVFFRKGGGCILQNLRVKIQREKNVTKKNNVRKTSDGRKRLVGGGKLDEFLALDE